MRLPCDWRANPEILIDARLEVRHEGDGVVIDDAAVGLEHLLDLGVYAVLHLGVLGQVEGERGERVGRGLEAGEEESDALREDEVLVQHAVALALAVVVVELLQLVDEVAALHVVGTGFSYVLVRVNKCIPESTGYFSTIDFSKLQFHFKDLEIRIGM